MQLPFPSSTKIGSRWLGSWLHPCLRLIEIASRMPCVSSFSLTAKVSQRTCRVASAKPLFPKRVRITNERGWLRDSAEKRGVRISVGRWTSNTRCRPRIGRGGSPWRWRPSRRRCGPLGPKTVRRWRGQEWDGYHLHISQDSLSQWLRMRLPVMTCSCDPEALSLAPNAVRLTVPISAQRFSVRSTKKCQTKRPRRRNRLSTMGVRRGRAWPAGHG